MISYLDKSELAREVSGLAEYSPSLARLVLAGGTVLQKADGRILGLRGAYYPQSKASHARSAPARAESTAPAPVVDRPAPVATKPKGSAALVARAQQRPNPGGTATKQRRGSASLLARIEEVAS